MITFTNTLRVLVIICFLSFIYNKTFNRDYFNYDSIPYVASAHLLAGNDSDQSHAYAWNLLKEKSQPSIFNDLCCSSTYRKSMSSDPQAFESHLPSYKTKSLYVYLIRLTSDMFKIDEFSALKWISFISVVLLTLIASIFFFNSQLIIYLCIFPILILMQIIPIARLLTPDSLNALVFLSASLSFLSNKKTLGYLLLLGSILIRQTNIIFYGAFLVFELREKNYTKFFAMTSLGLALYWINSSYFESIGYWSTFVSSLIRMPNTFVGFDPVFSISTFFITLAGKIDWMLGDPELNRLLALMFINFLSCFCLIRKGVNITSNNAHVPLIFVACSMISYVLIPFPDFRIYSGHLIASSLSFLFLLDRQKTSEEV